MRPGLPRSGAQGEGPGASAGQIISRYDQRKMRFCPQCGTPVTPGAKFCVSCGTPVTAPAALAADAVSGASSRPRQ